MVYYIADTHFGHEKIIDACKRPFASVKEMNHTLVQNWNMTVGNSDTVYVLGDLFYGCRIDTVLYYLCQLNGRKILIKGNHDDDWLQRCAVAEQMFMEISSFMQIEDDGRKLILSHRPIPTFHGNENECHIHGHIHNRTDVDEWPVLKQNPFILNAGVEINGYTPVSMEKLISNNQKWKDKN